MKVKIKLRYASRDQHKISQILDDLDPRIAVVLVHLDRQKILLLTRLEATVGIMTATRMPLDDALACITLIK